MASIKCRQCGFGIHYNSVPNGIEYIFIKKDKWECIFHSKFRTDICEMDETGQYPKLFRSDTIESDFPDAIEKVWVCPKCKCIHRFDLKGVVTETYKIRKMEMKSDVVCEGIVFDDYRWETITESMIPDERLRGIEPSDFVKLYDNGFVLSKNDDFSKIEWEYVKM